jgi:hypothetical protein
VKRTATILALTFAAVAAISALAADDEKDFTPLFNGKDLTGWRLRNRSKPSWSVEEGGILKNTAQEEEHNESDLVTTNKFWNFTVRYEYMTPKDANSGFFLRGRHEIQKLGDYRPNHRPDDTCNSSIYGFKAPDKYVTKPSGGNGRRRRRRPSRRRNRALTLSGEHMRPRMLQSASSPTGSRRGM